ncbi:MAG: plasmid pRiA4b ORF-3 family protein [Anaerolineaceae bacterium]|nr:plasmid pRiA4b ORF-3 family protein [Anaerolineaceae bacterium]
MTKSAQKILQIKITLREIKPPIWRRVLITDQMTLWDLHVVIQSVFGWAGYHLHEFKIGNVLYGDPEDSEFMDFVKEDEELYKVSDFNFNKGSQFTYLYDFGDGWKHSILIEKVLPHDKKAKLPQFLEGKRATPPEDVGGEHGYNEFLEAIKNPKHPEHEHYLIWVGGFFDPERVDLKKINYRIDLIAQLLNDWNLRLNTWIEDPKDWVDPNVAVKNWVKTLQKRDLEKIQSLPLLTNMRYLLSYLQENKVSGTSSTGNFSQKAVKDLVEKTGYSHPLLNKDEFSRLFKNENEVWAVYYIHLLAYWAELIDGGKGKLWKLTAKGENFLKIPPAEQLYTLFSGWWFHGYWLVTSLRFTQIQYLPPEFPRFIHTIITSTLASQSIDFTDFCKKVLKGLGFITKSDPDDYKIRLLCDDLEAIIIKPLESFGFIVCKKDEKILLSSMRSRELDSFQLSDFGREAFRAMIDPAFYRELKSKLN